MRRLIFPALLLLTAATTLWAAQASSALPVGRKPVITTAFSSEAVSALATDDDSAGLRGKRAVVYEFTTGGQTVELLLRVQDAPNGIFVDAIVEFDSVASLTSAVGNMTLTTAGHPSTTEDATDTSVLADAAP
jgi:hypothetical protein